MTELLICLPFVVIMLACCVAGWHAGEVHRW